MTKRHNHRTLIKSQPLRDAANGQDCTVRSISCNFDPSTSVLAHIQNGEGVMGGKTHDISAVIACSECHDIIDGRQVGYIEDHEIRRAIIETQVVMVGLGLIIIKGWND